MIDFIIVAVEIAVEIIAAVETVKGIADKIDEFFD
jgi:hypothetical protein